MSINSTLHMLSGAWRFVIHVLPPDYSMANHARSLASMIMQYYSYGRQELVAV